MKNKQIQFHATCDDLLELIKGINEKYIVYKVVLFPKFEVTIIGKKLNKMDIREADMIVISKSKLKKSETYNSFIKMQDNNLIITIGKETNDKLCESSMCIWTEGEIDTDFIKIIKDFKKQMIRGAWVLNPNYNVKKFYKNHLYTSRAQTLYENGVKICPVAGWNIYELTKD